MPNLGDGRVVHVQLPPPKLTKVVAFVGAPGEPGEQGPPGAGVSDAFEHIQSTPSASWSIDVPPGLGRTPGVTVYVGGSLVLTDVEANSSTVNIVFPSPTAGSAVLT